MRKNIFTAIFIFTLLLQNLASAADFDKVDWNSAPRFGDKKSFMEYLITCENKCQTRVPVVFTDGLFVNVEECLKMTKNSQYVYAKWLNDKNGKPRQVLYELNIYPGAKVAYAYRTGNTSALSAEEKQLYNVAVKIVNAANQKSTPLLKEHYIHEKITEMVTYYNANTNSKTPRHCTAVGALLDGKANCQGYADAFYMLCKMLGFNVSKMSGWANNESHVWNTIEFGDGRIYGVDVTWDDASFSFADSGEYNNYIYFNAPLEIMQTTHTWEAAYNPQLYPRLDGRYFYYTQEFWDTDGRFFAFHSSTAEDALGYIAQRIAKEGRRLSWGMAPYDSRYADVKFCLNLLVKDILPNRYQWYGYVKMNVAVRGKWLFYTVDAVANN